MKRICFVAQFPPPIHGLSKAVDTLYNSDLAKEFIFERIDLTNNRSFLKNILLLFKSKADLFYFTISQSKMGNIRDLILLQLLFLKKKKCTIHLHGGYYRNLIDSDVGKIQKEVNFKLMRKVDGAIVLSDSLRTIFKDVVRDELISVIPNCVDNEFVITEEEFQMKIKESDSNKIKQVLYLGNFIESKGYRKILELARIEKENNGQGKRNFHFNFAGKFFDEVEENYFKSYISTHKIEDYVTYYGVVDGEEKRGLLRRNHIFILITRYKNEGQPISILEAMINGLAIVTTDHAGIPDIVKHGLNGIVLNPIEDSNIPGLYMKIRELSDSSYKDYALTNREICVENYIESAYLEKFRRYFRRHMLS